MNLGIVLPQQVFTVVVSIGRTHDGVDVASGGLLIGEPNAGVMIEFDHQDRALDSIIERILFTVAADPAPPGSIQRRFDLRQFVR